MTDANTNPTQNQGQPTHYKDIGEKQGPTNTQQHNGMGEKDTSDFSISSDEEKKAHGDHALE